jgi:hypothetical protein
MTRYVTDILKGLRAERVVYQKRGDWEAAKDTFRSLGPSEVVEERLTDGRFLYFGRLPEGCTITLQPFSSDEDGAVEIHIGRHKDARRTTLRFVGNDAGGIPQSTQGP